MNETEMRKKSAPRGIYNKWEHKERRLNEIKDAIERYTESNAQIPIEWIREYNELTVQLERRAQEKHAMTAKGMKRLRENRLYRCQCTRCGKDKPADGYTQCEKCRDYRAEYLRKKRNEGA